MSAASLVFDLVAKDHASDKFDKIGRSSSGASAKLKTFAKAGALAAGAAVVGLAAGLTSAAKAAMADQAAQKLLAKQLRNSAGATAGQVKATEDWITKQGLALGVTDDDLRPALSRLVAATKDVDKAQSLATLAMDVSAGSGKSLKSVTEALVKAQNGSVGGLSRLGVATKNADGSTKSLKDITADLAKTYEGSASTAANTAQGKFGRLKLIFDETKESIGAKLLPILTSLATWFLAKGLPAIKKFGGWLGDTFGPIVGKLVGWFKDDLLPALKSAYEGAMPALKDAFESVKNALKSAQPFFDFVGKFFVDVLVPVFGKLIRTYLPLLGKYLELIGKYFGTIGKVAMWLWNSVLQPVFSFFIKAIGTALELVADMLDGLSNVPGFGWVKSAANALHGAADEAKGLGDAIKKIPDRTVKVNVEYRGRATGQHVNLGAQSSYLQTGEIP